MVEEEEGAIKKCGKLPFQNGGFSRVARCKNSWTVHCVPQLVTIEVPTWHVVRPKGIQSVKVYYWR